MESLDLMRSAVRATASVDAARTPQDAANKVLDVARALGYTLLSVVKRGSVQDEAGGDIVYSNCPDSEVSLYRERGYVQHDPLVNRGLQSDEPRSSAEIASQRLTPMEVAVMSHHARATGCHDALVIPVRRSANPSGVIVFGGLNPDTSAAARAVLTILGHCVYGRMIELQNLPQNPARAKTTLSPRETEVLTWVAKGKCDSEIAIILSMSERTARFHVANAKAKLDTASRVQAVTKAMELGLIAA